MIKVAGIDPGLSCGWAIAGRKGARRVLVASGVIRPPRTLTLQRRHYLISAELRAVFVKHEPAIAFAEDQFVDETKGGKKIAAALKISQARGVVNVAIGACELDVVDVAPSTLKKSVAGHGHASKDQVARMVAAFFGVELPRYDDESDAQALALHGAIVHRVAS